MNNIGPVAPHHIQIARAALQFMNWIDVGVAIEQAHPSPVWPTPPRRLGAEFPSFTERQASLSLIGARKQFAKGNLTADDLVEIERRCGWAERQDESE